MVKKLAFLIILHFLLGCNNYSKLVTTRKPINNTVLKLNGYYSVKEKGESLGLISIYFLYENGIILYAGSYKNSNLIDIESKIKTNYVQNNNKVAKNYIIDWGVFNIHNQMITIEKWEPTQGKRRSSIRKGVIIDDKSFRINYFFSPFVNKEYQTGDTYFFHQFSPKPDSTNNFIK
jgi:hypothetical protein